MSDRNYAVIMAGGGGTRLWPLSRHEHPKQSLRLMGERTLFQMAVDRLRPLLPFEQILVVTIEDQAEILRRQVPELPPESFIIEPAPKGTASVVGLAATLIQARDQGAVMWCLTADHFIRNVPAFQALLQAASLVARQGELVTLGIPPTHPSTGYGYICAGEKLDHVQGFDVYRAKAFKEKPKLEVAQDYLASGAYSWNSGMFVWRTDRILAEIQRWMPDLDQSLREIAASLGKDSERQSIESVWMGLESQTIDFGIMEHAERVSIIPAEALDWYDIGGWNRLFDVLETDVSGNVVRDASTLLLDVKDSLIYQAVESDQARLIAAMGIEDLIIVDTPDVLLVCTRERAEEVRHLVRKLESQGKSEYL